MQSDNIYSAPQANLNQGEITTYDPKMMSFNGRIGRARYIVYGLGMYILFAISAGGVAGITSLLPKSAADILMGLTFIVLYIGLITYMISLAKRRLNDINLSGWFVLLMFVPLVNLILGLALMFWPGTNGINRFGPMPTKNNSTAILAALIGFVFVTGILAAIAIPAYQDYVKRAEAAAQMQQSER